VHEKKAGPAAIFLLPGLLYILWRPHAQNTCTGGVLLKYLPAKILLRVAV
jgi:hypothetical protein